MKKITLLLTLCMASQVFATYPVLQTGGGGISVSPTGIVYGGPLGEATTKVPELSFDDTLDILRLIGDLSHTGTYVLVGDLSHTGNYDIIGSISQTGDLNIIGSATMSGLFVSALSPNEFVKTDNDGGLTSTPTISLTLDVSNILPISSGGTASPLGWRESTGLFDGGILSIGAPTTTFSITDGSGVVSNSYINGFPVAPIDVQWTGLTNIAATNLAGVFTAIGINSSGAVIQKANAGFSATEERDIIVLGSIVHVGAVITSVANAQQIAFSGLHSSIDVAHAIGIINTSGNVYGANGANLSLDKTSGTTFRFGSNYTTSKKNPHYKDHLLDTSLSFRYSFQDGIGGFVISPVGTFIDPDLFDDGTGTLATVANNRFTIQRIFFAPTDNSTVIQFGQEEYATLSDAKGGVTTEQFNTNPALAGAILRSFLIVQQGETDLNNSIFVEADKFGQSAVGGTGGVSVTLQTTYENSVQPQIVLDALRMGIEIRDNASPIADSLFAIQDISGASFFDVSATGIFTSVNFDMINDLSLTGAFLHTGLATTTGNYVVDGDFTVTGTCTGCGGTGGGGVTDLSATGVAFGNALNQISSKVSAFSFNEITDTLSLVGDLSLTGNYDSLGEFSLTGNMNVSGSLGVEYVEVSLLTTEPATPTGTVAVFAIDGDNNSLFIKAPDGTVTDLTLPTPTSAFCVLNHRENQGTGGDAIANGVWTARTLNNTEGDCSFLGLVNDQVSITETGVYRVDGFQPFFTSGLCKIRLTNVLGGENDVVFGDNINSTGHWAKNNIKGAFNVSSAVILEYRYYCDGGGGVGGGGTALNLSGFSEDYSAITFEKVQ